MLSVHGLLDMYEICIALAACDNVHVSSTATYGR